MIRTQIHIIDWGKDINKNIWSRNDFELDTKKEMVSQKAKYVSEGYMTWYVTYQIYSKLPLKSDTIIENLSLFIMKIGNVCCNKLS